MLTALGDTLMHQCAGLFVHSAVSDQRFFDRTVLGVHSIDGALNLATSFGIYKSHIVMAGFAMLQRGGARQFNHRDSRRDYDNVVLRPLSVTILEPLKGRASASNQATIPAPTTSSGTRYCRRTSKPVTSSAMADARCATTLGFIIGKQARNAWRPASVRTWSTPGPNS